MMAKTTTRNDYSQNISSDSTLLDRKS